MWSYRLAELGQHLLHELCLAVLVQYGAPGKILPI